MASLPIAQWQAALDRMETSLASATRSLDRAEERWERAVAPSAGEGEPPLALDRLDLRLQEWESRLRAAEELTATVEQELAERTAAVERWRELFAKWEELLKQQRNTSPVR
jgi:predicted  nucleic acid-binding Zn-ribbon protein